MNHSRDSPFDDLAAQRSPWNNEEIRRRSGGTARTGVPIRSRRSLTSLSAAKPASDGLPLSRELMTYVFTKSPRARESDVRKIGYVSACALSQSYDEKCPPILIKYYELLIKKTRRFVLFLINLFTFPLEPVTDRMFYNSQPRLQ